MHFITKHFSGERLKARALRGSSITFATYGFEQLLRLASNIVLTRLLFPEAFGIMALATVVLVGLSMLSDIGVGQSIVQNPKGTTPTFRNTAWVTQIGRGFILWLFACAIAYPMSLMYQEPILFPLISVLGITLAIKGFASTSIAIGNREIKIFRLSIVNTGTQVVNIILTIIFAYYYKSVWALAWGSLISSAIGVYVGHIYLNKGYKHRFEIDKEAFMDIINFGKWIFVSSLVGFLANQIDKVIVGKMLSMSELGIYTIAITLAQVPKTILFSLNRMILFPIYSIIQNEPTNEIRNKIFKTKIMIVLSLLPMILILAFFGQYIISILYDERYLEAGWMLQILALGTAVQIATNVGPFYLGFNKPRLFAYTTSIKAILLILSMIIGGLYWDAIGIITGISVSALLFYIFEIYYIKKFNLWFWKLDFFLLFIILIATSIIFDWL